MLQYLLNLDLPLINPAFKGNYMANGRFQEGSHGSNVPSYSTVLRWQLSANPQKEEKKRDPFRLKVMPGRSFLQQDNVLVWLGHASFFIQLNGVSLLTDPCLTDLPLIKRQVGLPCPLREFYGIDYLLLSHGHRDHYDTKSVNRLIYQNPQMALLLPLKLSELLGNQRKRVNYQEAAWWQQFRTKEGVDIYFLPAKHWNRRGLLDLNRNLWGSFLIKTREISIYFGADSAYGPHFREIREIAGAPDICMLPVGAYKPPYMMQEAHMNPEEAVQAFHDLQANVMIPMHYGTYDLSDEPLGEPVRQLESLRQEGKIQGELRFMEVGEVMSLRSM